MRIGVVQLNPTVGHFRENTEKILQAAAEAEQNKVEFLLFPEMVFSGYPPMDLLGKRDFLDEHDEGLQALVSALPPEMTVAIGHFSRRPPEAEGNPLFNTAGVYRNGERIFSQDKILLPSYDVFDETRYFEPGEKSLIFPVSEFSAGFVICEDFWAFAPEEEAGVYGRNPVSDLLDRGAEILFCLAASPFFPGKVSRRADLARKSGVPVVYCNLTGGNDSLIFDGNSFVLDGRGDLLYRGRAFEEDFFFFDLEKEKGPDKKSKGRMSFSGFFRGDTSAEKRAPACSSFSSSSPSDSLNQSSPQAAGESFYREIREALILGLKDYVRKSGFSRVHLGLSGGIDSAVVATLAVRALGAGRVRVFALPSRYSSRGSLDDAEELAKRLNISCPVLAIEPAFRAFLEILEPCGEGFESSASGGSDTTEENIQARIRGTLMMAYSNKTGSLPLVTGNKSEMATGYCTLYGDMAGGLAVIGDLFKTEVFGLAEYLNKDSRIIPSSILEKAPSAELRPDQKDEDSLPPYPLLDRILSLYLLEGKSGKEIRNLLGEKETVDEVLRLVERSEYKRQQAPPVLKISPKAFGRGRRIPIARSF